MRTIKLTLGQVTTVDDDDFEYLNQFSWFARKDKNTYYAARNVKLSDGKKTSIQMHREIMKLSTKMVIDHKDRNGLNNQKCNLRVVTNAQNCQNIRAHRDSKTGIKGVSFEKSRNKWSAYITLNYKSMRIGRFNDLQEAINARLKAEKVYHPFRAENLI
jgi:hypothetical protein